MAKLDRRTIRHCLEYTTRRIFLCDDVPSYKPLTIDAALNEGFSFQAAFRLPDDVETAWMDASIEVPEGWTGRVRRVVHVPMRHRNTAMQGCSEGGLEPAGRIPGYVPDALADETRAVFPCGETHSYWFNVIPGPDAKPGEYRIVARLLPEGGNPITMTARATLYGVRLAERRDFNITHWFYADSILDWYRLKPFEERFWNLAGKYFADYASHGLDTIYVPAFTPPLDGVKRPTQLIRVSTRADGGWNLDWTDVERWVRLAKKSGITHFEWVHPFTQWGAKFAIRIYEGQGEGEKLLWPADTGARSPVYRRFLSLYLSQLHDFLRRNRILGKSFFHVSDEPHGAEARAEYVADREMLKKLAPWMKTMDALSEIEYGREHLTDIPMPSIRIAAQFSKEKIPSWCYYCCGPRGAYLNRLIDTPLAKIAMHGFLFYKWGFGGFLHWGYNYWYVSQTRRLLDVFADQDGGTWPGWAYGDPFQVYPGEDGPMDSIRFEVFSESLGDLRLLQTVGLSPEDQLFRKIVDFNDFPKDAAWRRRARKALLKMGAR